MKIHEIKSQFKRKNKRRIGRGNAGKGGTTAGRGTKGQKSCSGFNIPRGFEGGQTKFIQRIPKIGGFKSHQLKNKVVKTSLINKNFKDSETVSPETLIKKGLIDKADKKIKILFDEKLSIKIVVKECLVSKKVADQIKK